MTTTALSVAKMGLDIPSAGCESFDVVYVDELGPQTTTVLASGHDDAADQVAFDGINVEKTIRRRDGDEADHTIAVVWTIGPVDTLATFYTDAA